MTGRVLRSIAAVAAAWVLSAGTAHAQAPVLAAPTTNGNNVTFNWSPTAGATGYRLDYGVATGAYIGGLPVGNVTTFNVGAPNGNFFIRVVAQTPGGDVPSNEVNFRVPQPPATPLGLVVARNGTGLVAEWNPGAGGASVDFYQLQVGTSPGTTLAAFNVNNAGWGYPANVPPGTYYVRAVAVSSVAGASSPSSEVVVNMPAGGACDPAISDFAGTAFSGLVSLTWSPIAGVSTFITASINGVPQVANLPLPPTGRLALGYVGTGFTSGTLPPAGTYDLSVRTVFSCGSQATTAVSFVNDGTPPPGARSANPAPGQLLPLPSYVASVVNGAAARRPDLLRNSCVETGGNNRFMFEVVKDLRAVDNRWGLNIKRGFQGLSQDIVTFNRSAGQDEGATTGPTSATRNISLYDMIGGHCGPSPGPNATEVSDATINGGVRAVWTLLPYIEAGYKP